MKYWINHIAECRSESDIKIDDALIRKISKSTLETYCFVINLNFIANKGIFLTNNTNDI